MSSTTSGLNATPQPRPATGRPADVKSLGVKPVAPNADVNAMAEQSQPSPIVVKQTDHLAIEGANKGEHRAPNTGANVTDAFKSQPAPRSPNPNDEGIGA